MTLADLVTGPAQTVYVSGAAYLGGQLLTALPIVGGSVTADCRRTKMRDATVTIGATDAITMEDFYYLLGTPGIMIALERGFVQGDGTMTGFPLGLFVIDELTYNRHPDGSTTLSATLSDLSVVISRASWTDGFQIPSGTALCNALNGILADRLPGVSSGITSVTTPGTLACAAVFTDGSSSDPWANAYALAQAYGLTLFFDASGVAQALPAPSLDPGAAVFVFAQGETAVMTEQARVTSLNNTYSGVIATGEGSGADTPVRGEAWDADASSETYYLGPFGKVPLFYSSSLIATSAQALNTATVMLSLIKGRATHLSWSQVVHPGLKPLDVVLVELSAGVLSPFILDAITIPLTITDVATAVARDISGT